MDKPTIRSGSTLDSILAFCGRVWTNLQGGVATWIGILAIVSFVLPSHTQISTRLAIPIFLIFLAGFVAITQTGWTAFLERDRGLPSITYSGRPPEGYGPYPLLCLLEPSELFSTGDLVTFWYMSESGVEQAIGVGIVVSRQQDDALQVLLREPLGEPTQILERLQQDEEAIREQILVRPNIHREVHHYREEEDQ